MCTFDIFVSSNDVAVCQLNTFNSMKVEDIKGVYAGYDAFLQLVSVSQYTTRCCHCA